LFPRKGDGSGGTLEVLLGLFGTGIDLRRLGQVFAALWNPPEGAVGGEAKTVEISERDKTRISQAEEKAAKLGANAIVGVSYGYETMGQGGSMLMIAISGTAVVID
jgi:uncharacterized protein YbjQ (UPF0145 family)